MLKTQIVAQESEETLTQLALLGAILDQALTLQFTESSECP